MGEGSVSGTVPYLPAWLWVGDLMAKLSLTVQHVSTYTGAQLLLAAASPVRIWNAAPAPSAGELSALCGTVFGTGGAGQVVTERKNEH